MTHIPKQPPDRNGLARALHRLAYRLAQRVMTLDVTEVYWIDLACARMPAVEPHFEFRLLTPDDLLHFARDPSTGLDPLLAQRAAGSRGLRDPPADQEVADDPQHEDGQHQAHDRGARADVVGAQGLDLGRGERGGPVCRPV